MANRRISWAVARVLRERRLALALTYLQVSRRSGFTPQYLANLEKGLAPLPPPDELRALAQTLEFDGVEDLLGSAYGENQGPEDGSAPTAGHAERWLRRLPGAD